MAVLPSPHNLVALAEETVGSSHIASGGWNLCGLVGIFGPRHSGDREALLSGVRSLRHRGPDSYGIWLDPDGSTGLGHARLSINDPSPQADQPLLSTNGELALVHNGEFYDLEHQRCTLAAAGHELQSRSDSEILLPLYADHGIGALQQLRGEFAFVLWDRQQHRLFAVRDRFGIKPLYYAHHSGRLYLASEVKGLFAMGVPAEWDLANVYRYHQTWLLAPQHTLYRGIHQVPPGHYLQARLGGDVVITELHAYWDFNYPRLSASPKFDLPTAALAVRAALEDAVRVRLNAEVPVGCYLSGGLDSCSVLTLAASLAPKPLHTFTLSLVDDPAYDEAGFARLAAKTFGTIHHEVPISTADLAQRFVDALSAAEMPFFNSNGVAKFLLSRAVRAAGLRVVLTGEGADEIFAGYTHFRKDVLLGQNDPAQEQRLLELARSNALAAPLMLAHHMTPALAQVERALGFVPSFLLANSEGTALALSLLATDFQAKFVAQNGWLDWFEQLDLEGQVHGRPRLHQALYLWSKSFLPQYLLAVLGDRMEMAHSVEGRLPFLDHKLVELVTQLPSSVKVSADLSEKVVLRAAMRGLMPRELWQRQKQPFLAPPATLTPGSPLMTLIQDSCRSATLGRLPFYDRTAVIALLDRLTSLPPAAQAGADAILSIVASMVLLTECLGVVA